MKLYSPPKIPSEKYFTLNVPQYIQLNNTGGEGYRECNLTVNAALCQYLTGALDPSYKSQGFREPEDVYATVLAKYGETTDHLAQTKALRDFGIESYFSYNTNVDELAQMLRLGFPVVMGVDYKSSGHMVLAVGISEQGIIVQCPYGIRAGAHDWWYEKFGQNAHAKQDLFTWGLVKQIFTVNSYDDGWARVITAVNGQKTALHPDVLGKLI